MKETQKLLPGITISALIAGMVVFFFMHNSQVYLKQLLHNKERELAEANQKNGLVNLMATVLNDVNDELNNNVARTLSDQTIERIAALSFSFKPYTVFINDSLSDEKLSPERGQLLILLSKMKIDSGTVIKIMSHSHFSSADLREADLSGTNLIGADLRGADLQDANLRGTHLNKANLSYANLWGTDMSKATLDSAIFKRAILKWAVLNDANLKNANLNGAELTSAQLRRINFQGGTMIWADAKNAMFNNASMGGTQLVGTNFSKANLSDAILCETNMTRVNLTEAIIVQTDLTGAELNGVDVGEKNWISLLQQWRVEGADSIQIKYKTENHPSKTTSKFRVVNN